MRWPAAAPRGGPPGGGEPGVVLRALRVARHRPAAAQHSRRSVPGGEVHIEPMMKPVFIYLFLITFIEPQGASHGELNQPSPQFQADRPPLPPIQTDVLWVGHGNKG